MLNGLGSGVMGELDGTGVARPVGGREHVPCLPGHGDGAMGVRWHGRDTRRAKGLWAAPGGVARGLRPLLAATGGAATAEAPNAGEARCYRRQEGSTHACEAPDKRERLRGTCQVHCLRVRGTDERKRH